ncbi:hypothetical protein FOZ63_032210, partial [Perkinsus olseni]
LRYVKVHSEEQAARKESFERKASAFYWASRGPADGRRDLDLMAVKPHSFLIRPMALALQSPRSFWLSEFQRGRASPWKQAIRENNSGSSPRCGILTARYGNAPAIMLTRRDNGRWLLTGHCQGQLKHSLASKDVKAQKSELLKAMTPRNRYAYITSDPAATCREVLEELPLPASATAEQAVRMVCELKLSPELNSKTEYLQSLKNMARLPRMTYPRRAHEDIPALNARRDIIHKPKEPSSNQWEHSVVSLAPNLCGLSDGHSSELAAAIYHPPNGNWTFAFRCQDAVRGSSRVFYFSAPDRSDQKCVDMLRKQTKGLPVARMIPLMCASRDEIPREFILKHPPMALAKAMSSHNRPHPRDKNIAYPTDNESEQPTPRGWADSVVSLAPNLCGVPDGKFSEFVIAIYRPPNGNWMLALRCEDASEESSRVFYYSSPDRSDEDCRTVLMKPNRDYDSVSEMRAEMCSIKDTVLRKYLLEQPPAALQKAMSIHGKGSTDEEDGRDRYHPPTPPHNKPEKPSSSGRQDSVVPLGPNLCGLSDGKSSKLAVALYRPLKGNWTVAFRCEDASEESQVFYFSSPKHGDRKCVDILKEQSQGLSVSEMLQLMCLSKAQIPREFILEHPPMALKQAMSQQRSEIPQIGKDSVREDDDQGTDAPNDAHDDTEEGQSSTPTVEPSREETQTAPPVVETTGAPMGEATTPTVEPISERTTPPSTSTGSEESISITTQEPTKRPAPLSTSTPEQTSPTQTAQEATVKPHDPQANDDGQVDVTEEDEVDETEPKVPGTHPMQEIAPANSTQTTPKSSAFTQSTTATVTVLALFSVIFPL